MDIKYVYIHAQRRNALLLSVLDVYSRRLLEQILWWRMRKEQLIWLLHRVLQQHATTNITIRNDNGSQFIAHVVEITLKMLRSTRSLLMYPNLTKIASSKPITASWSDRCCVTTSLPVSAIAWK